MTDPAAELRRRRERAVERVESFRADLEDFIDSASSTTGDDEHDPEGATVGFERAQTQAFLDVALAQLDEIDAALVRVAVGGYGTCTVCGRPIGAERLAARPTALRCITCAR